MLAHAGVPHLAGGILGVDVFYVLSGFLITGLLAGEHRATGRLRIAEFYARRLKRLLPALLVMLSVVLLAATVLLAPTELREQGRSAPYAATWTSNLFFALAQMDYFAELQARDLFLHTWSLGVEEQYYLAWPLLLMFALRGPGGGRRRLSWALAALFAGSFALFLSWCESRPLWAFYQMPARGWQFALGAAAWAITAGSGRQLPTQAASVIGLVGLALVGGSALALPPAAPGYGLLVPSLGAALVLGSGAAHGGNVCARLLSAPPLVWLGDRSYSWYLWHWPVLMLGAAFGAQHAAAVAVLVAGSLLLATLSYAFVERPLWKGAWSRAIPASRAIPGAVLLMAASLAGPVLLARHVASAPPEGEAALAAAARLDVPEVYAAGCDSWYHSAEVRACLFGDAEAPRTVVILGDSVGLQWFEPLRALFPEPEWRIAVLTKSACPIVDEDYFYPRIGAVYAVCRQWRDAALTALPQLKPAVVMVGSGYYDFTREQWVEGSARVLSYLKTVAPRVVVIAPTPALSFDGPGCLERRAGRWRRLADVGLGGCSEPQGGGTAQVTAYLREAAARSGATVLDLADRVCPGGICSARAADGSIVFRDSQHLTAAFTAAQLDAVRERLAPVLQDLDRGRQ